MLKKCLVVALLSTVALSAAANASQSYSCIYSINDTGEFFAGSKGNSQQEAIQYLKNGFAQAGWLKPGDKISVECETRGVHYDEDGQMHFDILGTNH